MSRQREEKRLKTRARWAERDERMKSERDSRSLTMEGLCFNIEKKV